MAEPSDNKKDSIIDHGNGVQEGQFPKFHSWFLNKTLHRVDGPAVEDEYVKEWWFEGKRHREDGPAVEYTDGTKEWWKNGQLHREDGPAEEHSNGVKVWALHGKKLTEDEVNAYLLSKQLAKELPESDVKEKKLKI